MTEEEEEDKTIYRVVVNHEEQYSIWPDYKDIPLGWKDTGKSGLKPECLAYVNEVWTDMRPLSLRKKMEADAKKQRKIPPSTEKKAKKSRQKEPPESLPLRLSKGEHPVEAGLGREKTVKEFFECIDRGYVHIKFTQTRGGTELGVTLDRDLCDFSKANSGKGTGTVHLEGGLVLDYVKVRCIADIDLKTLKGKGHLDIINEEP